MCIVGRIDRVVARVRSESLKHGCIVIAHCSDMNLHRPIKVIIFFAQAQEHIRRVSVGLLVGNCFAAQAFCENFVHSR